MPGVTGEPSPQALAMARFGWRAQRPSAATEEEFRPDLHERLRR